MSEIEDLDPLDGAANPRFPEGQLPSTVNDGDRASEGITARWYRDTNGSIVPTGTADALLVAANQTLTVYYDGLQVSCTIQAANTGPATLDVDSIGAKKILWPGDVELAEGDLISEASPLFTYETDADAGTGAWLIGRAGSIADNSVSTSKIQDGAVTSSKIAEGAALPVGVPLPYIGTTAPAGWLLLNGDTIGSAASAAIQASDDYETLFKLFWDSMADTEAPVSGGRGASADDDWAADKTLTMSDARSRGILGTGQGSGLTNRVNGITDGEEDHTQLIDEMPSHKFTVGPLPRRFGAAGEGSGNNWSSDVGTSGSTGSNDTNTLGNDDPFNVMQPFLALTMIVKY